MSDLHERLVAALRARLEVARESLRAVGAVARSWDEQRGLPWRAEASAALAREHDPAATEIRRVEALLRVVERHQPTLQTVEWFHDQTGKGEAECCPSCRPDEPTDWHPRIGEAGIEPEGFVPSYVVSPCPTLADLAAGEGIEVEP